MSSGSSRRLPRRSSFLLVLVVALTTLPAAALGSGAQAAPGAAPGRLFTELASLTSPVDPDWIRPEQFTAYDVALDAVGSRLEAAPSARAAGRGATPARISLPDPSGRLVAFEVVEDSIMEPGLAEAHPEISTFAGRGVEDPTQTVRLDLTPLGFHASVRTLDDGRAWYIDPAANGRGVTEHLSYYGASLPEPGFDFEEKGLRELAEEAHAGPGAGSAGVDLQRVPPGGQVPLRTYRLALATDPAYAAYFGGDDTSVLAAKVTLMNRVNHIYNDDFAIKMVLVDGTDTELNFATAEEASGANGPCGADPCYDAADLDPETGGCSSALLSSNTFALGQVIGADDYDIGHIALGINGGGIAGLGVVGESRKAAGCTGLPFPTGDFFAVDYVAHEMGHQFNGNHTFNGTQGACSLTNRNGGTSVEPGSGSSVMAYAGICGQDDLQPHTDPYFSQRSIDEVDSHVTASPADYAETQVISLRGFDTDGERVTLAYQGRAATIERGALTYNVVAVQQKIAQLTGEPDVLVGGYNDVEGSSPNDGGFLVSWNDSEDHPRIEVTGGSAGVTGFTGVPYEGGPGTNRGASVEVSANHAPAVVAPADKTIPFRTPFTLTGSGSDADGDELVYLWEQNNAGSALPNGGTALTSNSKNSGPLFRVFGERADVSLEESLEYESPGENIADGDPSRTFPDLEQILAGNTNAKTGTCPAPPPDTEEDVPVDVVECYAEFLPTASRTQPLSMRLTARDGFPTAGGTQYDDTVLTVSTSAGPFLVTSQGDGAPVVGGEPGTVSWAVNGTNTAALAQNVRILLSTDGGQTYPTVLASATPNDGSHEVTWPNAAADEARVKVEAVDNYFFDLNDTSFTIETPLTLTAAEPQTVQHSDDLDAPVTLTATSEDHDGDELTAVVAGVPGLSVTRGATSADGERPGTAEFVVAGPVTATPGEREAVVTVSEPGTGARTAESAFAVTVTPEDAAVTWTGDTEVVTEDASAPVRLETEVADPDDGARGDVTGASVSFVDRETDEVLCTAPVTGGPLTGSAGCSATLQRTDETTTYTVGTVVQGAYARDAAADDTTVVVRAPEPDTEAPETEITDAPSERGFVLGRTVRVSFAGSEDTRSYECTLDRQQVPCADGEAVLRKVTAGKHVFRVAARDEAGNLDQSPAVRRFAAPFNDRVLDRSGGWQRRQSDSAYRGSWLRARERGAEASLRVHRARVVALVVGQGPRYGRVAVYFRGERIDTVSLAAPEKQGKVLVEVARFDDPTSGRLRIVTLGGRTVRLEGLGVA